MATSVTTAGARAATQESTVLKRLGQWIQDHKQTASYIAIAIVLATALFLWNLLSTRTAERAAAIRLDQARLAVESRNYPLAASELSQLAENYAGTHAAEEGTILLAQVRLAQGQSQTAVQILTKFAPGASKAYRAQAYGLLGAAYENAGRMKEAAEAYQRAADAARFPFLRGQFLSDAGRAWAAAGDTARALAAYQTIVTKLDSTTAVMEARVRIGELTKGAGGR
jgi:predicted negative regulator of RcsB-dependent stress response